MLKRERKWAKKFFESLLVVKFENNFNLSEEYVASCVEKAAYFEEYIQRLVKSLRAKVWDDFCHSPKKVNFLDSIFTLEEESSNGKNGGEEDLFSQYLISLNRFGSDNDRKKEYYDAWSGNYILNFTPNNYKVISLPGQENNNVVLPNRVSDLVKTIVTLKQCFSLMCYQFEEFCTQTGVYSKIESMCASNAVKMGEMNFLKITKAIVFAPMKCPEGLLTKWCAFFSLITKIIAL